ncbi:MAG: hypothetical protein AAF149_08600 [Bacteroidota bacterium]
MKIKTEALKAKVIHNGHIKTLQTLLDEQRQDITLFYGKSIDLIKQSVMYKKFNSLNKFESQKRISIYCVRLIVDDSSENHLIVLDVFNQVKKLFNQSLGVVNIKFEKSKFPIRNTQHIAYPIAFSSNSKAVKHN